ncbi:hypothetical protein GCM10009715_23320 [Paeniglutamicibacter psychrophenolicus]
MKGLLGIPCGLAMPGAISADGHPCPEGMLRWNGLGGVPPPWRINGCRRNAKAGTGQHPGAPAAQDGARCGIAFNRFFPAPNHLKGANKAMI